jgi:hypothetical protein
MGPSVRLLALLVLAAAGAACDENLSTIAGPTPNLEPTFSAIQRDIFAATDASGRTACANHHTPASRAFVGGLALDGPGAYDELVNVPSRQRPGLLRVAPGDPDNSYLIHKIEGRAGIIGRRLPANGPPYLTDGQVLIIRRWIARGAPRD